MLYDAIFFFLLARSFVPSQLCSFVHSGSLASAGLDSPSSESGCAMEPRPNCAQSRELLNRIFNL